MSLEWLKRYTEQISEEADQGIEQGTYEDSNASKLWIRKWITDRSVPVTGEEKEKDGNTYIYVECPQNPDHKDAAVIIGNNGTFGFKCFHDSCSNLNWHSYRKIYEPEAYADSVDSASGTNSDEGKKTSQTDILLKSLDKCELFHDEVGEAHACLTIASHKEVYPCSSEKFRLWLIRSYYEVTGRSCGGDTLNQVIGVANAKAKFEGAEVNMALRCAASEDAFWYDLADKNWQAVKITDEGWSIESSPKFFRRFGNSAPQVMPSRHGDVYKLRPFVNLADETDFKLLLVYIITCLIPNVPKVVMPVSGERGASKSTLLRIIRRLVDPAHRELLNLPSDLRELSLTLSKNYMPAFDNLSGLSQAQSDLLCCASTGGGISKRKLYTDDDEVILNFLRCVTLNGISQVATKPDLLDRSIFFELSRVNEEKRMPENEFWKIFESVRPKVLGGMFDVLVSAIRIRRDIKIEKLPRMADFCLWGFAVAEAMGWSGEEFLSAYRSNISDATTEAINNSPLASAIVSFMRDKSTWEGKASKLLEELETVARVESIDTFSKSWPKSANALSKRLIIYKANLLEAGINYRKELDRHSKTYAITLESLTEDSPQPPASPQRETTREETLEVEGLEELNALLLGAGTTERENISPQDDQTQQA